MSDRPVPEAEAKPSPSLASQWPVEKLVAILEAEPWLLHRRVECVNVSCEASGWCIGCDPWGEAPCSEHPWPCAFVIENDPTFAAGRAQAATDIRSHLGPDPSPASPVWWAGYTEALSDCAKIAARGGVADLSKDLGGERDGL